MERQSVIDTVWWNRSQDFGIRCPEILQLGYMYVQWSLRLIIMRTHEVDFASVEANLTLRCNSQRRINLLEAHFTNKLVGRSQTNFQKISDSFPENFSNSSTLFLKFLTTFLDVYQIIFLQKVGP